MTKYEVPTMNISKFEVENVLTLSGVNSVEAANEALVTLGVNGGVKKTTVANWNEIF